MKSRETKAHSRTKAVALLAMCAILTALSDHFLTVDNLMNVFRQSAVNALLALGQLLVIVTAGIDLSVGSVAALCGIAAVIGNRVRIRPKKNDDWEVVPNLWGANIGPPSAMKTQPRLIDADSGRPTPKKAGGIRTTAAVLSAAPPSPASSSEPKARP